MRLKKSSFWSKIPNWVWVLISLAVAIAIWLFAAYTTGVRYTESCGGCLYQ